MEKYFKGLPFEKVTVYGIECFKSKDGRYFKIDEGRKFVAIECAPDEAGVKINDFEDVDLFDKDTEDADMLDVVRSVLEEVVNESLVV